MEIKQSFFGGEGLKAFKYIFKTQTKTGNVKTHMNHRRVILILIPTNVCGNFDILSCIALWYVYSKLCLQGRMEEAERELGTLRPRHARVRDELEDILVSGHRIVVIVFSSS